MEVFPLPATTLVNRVIPKNTFDAYATPKQKAALTSQVQRMVWVHKLAPETINLTGNEIREIEVIRLELKSRKFIPDLLALFDKAMPYPIVFVVQHEDEVYVSASVKHPHPVEKDQAVVDASFCTPWMEASALLTFNWLLKGSLDAVYLHICQQISGTLHFGHNSLQDFVAFTNERNQLLRELERLQNQLKRETQFNKKVERNVLVQQKKAALQLLEKGGQSS